MPSAPVFRCTLGAIHAYRCGLVYAAGPVLSTCLPRSPVACIVSLVCLRRPHMVWGAYVPVGHDIILRLVCPFPGSTPVSTCCLLVLFLVMAFILCVCFLSKAGALLKRFFNTFITIAILYRGEQGRCCTGHPCSGYARILPRGLQCCAHRRRVRARGLTRGRAGASGAGRVRVCVAQAAASASPEAGRGLGKGKEHGGDKLLCLGGRGAARQPAWVTDRRCSRGRWWGGVQCTCRRASAAGRFVGSRQAGIWEGAGRQ